MNLKIYYRTLKHDPDGKLVKDTGLIPSGSYVIQFLELMKGLLDGQAKFVTDVDEAEGYIIRDNQVMNTNGRVKAPVSNDEYGIVVGTNDGSSAEDNEDYALDTKILHSGIGAAGCLNYQAVTFVVTREVGPNIDFDISRTFLNETGVGITVKEIGIICRHSGFDHYHLFLRDVVADELVGDAETLTVIYTLRTTA